MIRKIKFWLLNWLLDDISKRLVEMRGHIYLADVRTTAGVYYLATQVWGAEKKVYKEED